MNSVVMKLMQLRGLGRLRGRGDLELNSQPYDTTQRKIHERDELPIQREQKENHGMSSGRWNRSITVWNIIKADGACGYV